LKGGIAVQFGWRQKLGGAPGRTRSSGSGNWSTACTPESANGRSTKPTFGSRSSRPLPVWACRDLFGCGRLRLLHQTVWGV